jgi:hypothetical protein
MNIINIIPSDYIGDPRKSLGYCWQDYKNRTPGIEVIVTRDKINGIDYTSAAKKALREAGLASAYVTCMWAGGFQGDIGINESLEHKGTQGTPLSASESIQAEYAAIRLDEMELEELNSLHSGFCQHCHSYCYGDCEATESF